LTVSSNSSAEYITFKGRGHNHKKSGLLAWEEDDYNDANKILHIKGKKIIDRFYKFKNKVSYFYIIFF
jgi:hypothetical protein